MQEAYLDESYIHEHYAQVNGSIYDPADDEFAEPKGKHKGGRYCFIVSIKGPGQSSTPGIIPESLWPFCPQNKEHHQADYHKAFNSQNFVRWLREQLIPNLT